MKSILLASASIVAFAGAAAAEVSFTGSTTLGFNTDDVIGPDDEYEGFYFELDLGVGFSQELDNGLTAGVDFDIEIEDGDISSAASGDDLTEDDILFYLTTETAGLYLGVTSFAAESLWTSAGDMEQDGFSEASDEFVLKGTMMFNNIEAAVSYVLTADDDSSIYDESAGADNVDQLSVAATGTFGNFTVGFAYQEEASWIDDTYGNDDFNADEVFGVFGSTTFGAADVTLAYASNETTGEDSMGLKVAYPIGPVTPTFYYVDESNGDANLGLNVAYSNGPIAVALDYQDDQGTEKVGLEGSYDVGNGIMVYAGYLTEDGTEDRYYVAGEYDLGGGASLLFSYVEDESNVDEDEVGANEYQRGTTVEVAFEF